MNIDHKHVIIGQLFEQSWLLKQQLPAIQAELEKTRNELIETGQQLVAAREKALEAASDYDVTYYDEPEIAGDA